MRGSGVGSCLQCGKPTAGTRCAECGGVVLYSDELADDLAGAGFVGASSDSGPAGVRLPDCTVYAGSERFPGCELLLFDGGIRLERQGVVWGWERDEIAEVLVDDATGVKSRITVSRVLLLGPVGLLVPKQTEVAYLTITGSFDTTLIEVPGVPPPRLRAAVEQALGSVGSTVTEDEGPRPAASVGTMASERLRSLADLHAQGLITDDEFAAKRAEVISEL